MGSSSSVFAPVRPFPPRRWAQVGRHRGPLYVAHAGDRDDHRLLGDEVVHIEIADLFPADLRAASRRRTFASVPSCRPGSSPGCSSGRKNAVIFEDVGEEFVVLVAKFFLLRLTNWPSVMRRMASAWIGVRV